MIVKWFSDNLLKFNDEKCHLMVFGDDKCHLMVFGDKNTETTIKIVKSEIKESDY